MIRYIGRIRDRARRGAHPHVFVRLARIRRPSDVDGRGDVVPGTAIDVEDCGCGARRYRPVSQNGLPAGPPITVRPAPASPANALITFDEDARPAVLR